MGTRTIELTAAQEEALTHEAKLVGLTEDEWLHQYNAGHFDAIAPEVEKAAAKAVSDKVLRAEELGLKKDLDDFVAKVDAALAAKEAEAVEPIAEEGK